MGKVNLPPVYRYITDTIAAGAVLESLHQESLIGLDTETYWDRTIKAARVSLVQLAARTGEVVIIDTLAAGIEVVRELVESPSVMMAAHNARFDELVLMKAGLSPAVLIDTLRLSRAALDLPSYSLAEVTAYLFGIRLDKSFQQSNWHRRPLSRAQLDYAAIDAYATLRVYEELQTLLESQGRFAEAIQTATLKGEPPRSPRRKRKLPPAPPLTQEQRRLVSQLKKWRLQRAFAQKVPAYMVCSDRTLEDLARTQPATVEALQNIYGLGETKIASYGKELLIALQEALQLKED